MKFDVGSLVHARGREWVVLPESKEEEDLLVLRPLGGSEDEITGIYLPLEPDVREARFPPPDPARDLGNHNSSSLLREAVRLGFRSGAGPFRSLGRINVEPRPYQLVPLLMALRLDPVRMLIADDVGIGKTVEALLILREMLRPGGDPPEHGPLPAAPGGAVAGGDAGAVQHRRDARPARARSRALSASCRRGRPSSSTTRTRWCPWTTSSPSGGGSSSCACAPSS